jgi:tetratricopeptide (TPR) repeat protein
MLDLGAFTIPLLSAGGIFLAAILGGNDIAIDQIRVLSGLDAESHNELVLTRELMDELRRIQESASIELTGIDVGGSGIDKSIASVADYFNLSTVVNSIRNVAGLTSYHITSEITPDAGEIRFTARIFANSENDVVTLVTLKGKSDDLRPMFHDAAIQILTTLSPYLVALHYYREELANSDFGFPKTREMLGKQITESARLKSYLAYDLIGRTFRIKAELDTKLPSPQKAEALDSAEHYLKAALVQAPEFFHSNVNLAMVYADKHEYDLADRFFAKAVGLNPNNLTGRQRWAEMLAEQGRNQDAIFQYVAAVELAPHNASFRDRLAGLYLKANRPDAARWQWQAALAIDPLHKAFADHLDALGSAVK